MKKTKNALLIILGGLSMITFAIVSCSKDKGTTTPAKPTITSVTPSTAAIGQEIVIAGTNLTSSTVTVGGITATVTANTAISITTTVPAGVATGVQEVKATNTGGSAAANITVTDPLPANSNLVAAAKLAAYWPFRTDGKETKSNITPEKNVGVTFGGADGPFGAYATFASGYLIYPTHPYINGSNNGSPYPNGLDQFSISMWVKIKNNNNDLYPATGGKYTSLFQVSSLQVGGPYGPYALTLRTNQSRPVDEFAFGSVLRNIDGHEFSYGPVVAPDKNYDHLDDSTYAVKTIVGAGNGTKWIHVVQSYFGYSDNPRPLITYINGEKVDERKLYALVWPGENLNPRPGGDVNKVSFGTFQFLDDFAAGAWGASPLAADAIYWAHGINGGISDVRFFGEPIEDADVNALYQLGLQGK